MLIVSRSRACLPTFPAFLGALALALASPGASAQTVKLNGPLARPVGADVRGFQVDPKGRRVVYLADQDVDDLVELYSVRPGKAPIRLSAPIPPWSDIASFQLAPDGRRVAYLAYDQVSTGLYSVDAGGGPVIRLDGLPTGRVRVFEIDPTSTRVVFLASPLGNGRDDVFSVPLDGSAPAVKLNSAAQVHRFKIRSGQVLFLQGLQTTALFAAPIEGSREPVQVTPVQPGNSWGSDVSITPDGSRAILVLNRELFSVSLDGSGTSVQLSTSLPDGGVRSFRLSPDGTRAVYSRDDSRNLRGNLYSVSVLGSEAPIPLWRVSTSPLAFEIDATGTRVVFLTPLLTLLSIPILGGTPTPITDASVVRFQVSPQGEVVFAESSGPGPVTLRSAPVGGGPGVFLATTLYFGFPEFAVTGDSVLYRGRASSSEPLELFTVPIDGSRPPLRVNPALGADRQVQVGFKASGDGKRVAYTADQDSDDVVELYLAPSDASRPPIKLNPRFPLGRVEGDVGAALFSADGTRAVFLADANEDDVFELFSASTAGGEAPVRLNDPLVRGGDVARFELAGERVVYLADQEADEVHDLFSVPLGGGTPVRLGSVESEYSTFRVTPDGSRVVFAANGNQLHAAPVDGSAPSTPLLAASTPSTFEISPSSDRLVCIADPDGDAVWDLFSIPVSGGSSVRLSAPGTFVRDFRITPGGQRVLYRIQTASPVGIGLSSVPIDGSASPVGLSASLPAGILVTSFAPSPDGTRVVFAANAVSAQVFELFSAPVDGSAAPIPLHTANAERPEITPDGTRVVYLVQKSRGLFEIHVAPLDGHSPPLVLSTAHPFDTYFSTLQKSLQITADSAHVVFRAGLSSGSFRLFGVPLDGSRPPRMLSNTRDGNASAHDDFRLTPDGKTLLYRLNEYGQSTYGSELYEVPVDAPLPVKLATETVSRFELAPDGTRVLHLSDLDTPGVTELYVTKVLEPGRRIAPR